MSGIDEFIAARRDANRAVLEQDHLGIKRLLQPRRGGVPGRRSARPNQGAVRPGGVAGAALQRLRRLPPHAVPEGGLERREIVDALNVGMIVGGSIVIPHLRHAVTTLEELRRRGEVAL